MRTDIYQKLHEFNLHIDQGIAALREMADAEEVSAKEIRGYTDYFEEIRSSVCGYLTSIVSGQEGREAGRLFGKRLRQEMAEDPMHPGWLEEEREKKRLKELRRAKKLQNTKRKNRAKN